MRARVGDVYMRWDQADKVPLFSAIPACPRQDTEAVEDFLTGRVPARSLNLPTTGADCRVDGPGRGARVLARERMQSIAPQIRTRTPLTAAERPLVTHVKSLPLSRLRAGGVRDAVADAVI